MVLIFQYLVLNVNDFDISIPSIECGNGFDISIPSN